MEVQIEHGVGAGGSSWGALLIEKKKQKNEMENKGRCEGQGQGW